MPRSKPVQKPNPVRANLYAAPEFSPFYGRDNSVLVPRVVPDPYPHPDRPDETVTAIASIRDDPHGRYFARGQIDHTQWRAGLDWLRWWQIATLGGLKGYELKDPVQGGGAFPEALSDARIDAADHIMFIRTELGKEGDELLREVLGHGRFINEIVVQRGEIDPKTLKPRQRIIDYLSKRYQECLTTLAEIYGVKSKQNGHKRR